MASPEATNQNQIIWLTDRSRYVTGTSKCPRERYLGNHFGPTGYGIVRKSESLPLATGKYTHQALEYLFRHLKETDQFPSDEIIRTAIKDACADYHTKIAQRGYAGMLQSERSDYIVVEQTCLITGLVWAFASLVLPWIYQQYQIVEVEQENLFSLTPDGSVAVMLRQDVLAIPRNREGLAYFEFKTTGYAGDAWAQAWETKPQLSIGSFGVAERLGRQLTELYIVGLHKGRRETVGEGADQWQRQDSPFCYGWCRPGNPPLAPDDWKPSYRWADPLNPGKNKQVSNAHKKQGLWTLPQSDWVLDGVPVATQRIGAADPVEWWTRFFLPKDVVAKAVFLIGPMVLQPAQVSSLKTQMLGEELRWQQALWHLYEYQEAWGADWSDPGFQEELDRTIPCSWDCRRFGTRHQCQFLPICFKQPGWEDPLGTGKYVPRRPHHTPELEQAISRGLLPEQSEEEEQDDHD